MLTADDTSAVSPQTKVAMVKLPESEEILGGRGGAERAPHLLGVRVPPTHTEMASLPPAPSNPITRRLAALFVPLGRGFDS